jgi:formate--tetrahydrofolate ligase
MTSRLRNIRDVARDLGIPEEAVHLYGNYKAKIDYVPFLEVPRRGKYVAVTAMTPTPFGEGKTTVAVGLAMALARQLGLRAVATLRQPSMGPTFGIKGGGAGGGLSQVVPMEEMNLHLTGDVHAVAAAHNLLAAMVDNHLHHGNALGIDQYSIQWPRVVDMNDRALRQVVVGLGGRANGPARETEFIIAVASEVMSVLSLSTSLKDLRQRLGRIVIGRCLDGRWVMAEDLKAAGAMAAILREALKPNLMQSSEGTPVLVHTGPFANIAHGNSSILADRVGLALADVVVTESGFGADMGLEKLIDIKARYSGELPNVAVMVATVRSLKYHGLPSVPKARDQLLEVLSKADSASLERGAENLARHIEIAKIFGLHVVVALNRRPEDSDREATAALELARGAGADAAVEVEVFRLGSQGAVALARKVLEVMQDEQRVRYLYDSGLPLREKIETIATRIYGADGVDFTPAALAQLENFEKAGYGELPVCMAKTPLSLSHDPALRGRPKGFRLPVTGVRLYSGAGFLVALAGDIQLMPGLPIHPAAESIDVDDDGNVLGLF